MVTIPHMETVKPVFHLQYYQLSRFVFKISAGNVHAHKFGGGLGTAKGITYLKSL